MQLKVVAKGRGATYDATGLYDGKSLIVQKGSKISESVSQKIQPVVLKLRAEKNLVSAEYVLLEDVTFRSPSTAASFVSGSIANGLIKWRSAENGKTLKELSKANG